MSGTRTPITRVAAAVAAAVVSLATLTACAGGPGAVAGGTADDSWTVLTYMIADTNLEYFQMEDMREQEAVGSRPGFSLVSYLDRSEEFSDEDVLGLGDFTGAKTIEVRRSGSVELTDAPNAGTSNTGDPEVLAAFIEYAAKKYPAAHYALIINDHGSSWPGVGADGSADDDQLTLAELHDGIAAGLDGAGLDKLDMIGFDACLMATYETASTLQTLADRMVASQELEPGYGWDYTSLEAAARGGSVDDLAASIIKAYDEQSLSEGEAEVTLSEIDLTKFAAVDTALDAFTEAVTPDLDANSSDIGRALTNSLSFGRTPDYDFFMTDLGQLSSQLGGPGADLAAAIEDVIVTKVDGQATRGASGLAIYFPPSQNAFNPDYTDVEAASGWTDFLNAYYDAGQAAGGDLAFVDGTLFADFTENGFIVAQQVATPANQITDVNVYYGYVEGGQTILVGQEPASLDSENYAVGFFDTYQLWISDGVNETSFYSSYEVNQDADVATIGVPIAYYPAGSTSGSQAFLQMTYAPSTGTILSETFYGQDSSGAYSEIAPDPGATFEALKIDLASNAFFQSSPSILLSADPDALQFEYRPLASGTTVYAEVVIENSAGQALSAGGTGVKP